VLQQRSGRSCCPCTGLTAARLLRQRWRCSTRCGCVKWGAPVFKCPKLRACKCSEQLNA
jgi:hypothetical protein